MRVGLALLVAVLTGLAAPTAGLAAPTPTPTPATATQGSQQLARLDVETLHPRVVTATGADLLTVAGRVVNTGDRQISDLAIRLQRDDPLTDGDTARAALEGTPQAPFVTEFSALDAELQPGQSTRFRIVVPLGTGPEQRALQISEPGVYPLLVNLNGTPDFGGPARLATVALLLPVLGMPTTGTQPVAPAAPPRAAAPLSIVWPLAATPARLPTGPGEPVLLAGSPDGDPIGEQLAPGGRLDGLLRALEHVVPPGSPLAGGLCVAIDPSLLDTVDGMSRGYRVATPGGNTEGTGAADARRWLDRLRTAVAGRCVLPLPYGDPDLVALSRAGLTDLEAMAISTGSQLVADLLGVQPLTGVAWPADGVLDKRTLFDLAALENRAVLLDPRGLRQPPESAATVALAAGTGTHALLADPLLTTALDPAAPVLAAESNSEDTDGLERPVAQRPGGTAAPLGAQDAMGALAVRALEVEHRPVLLVPPRRWQARGEEAVALLRMAERLVQRGFLVPRDLPGLVRTPPAGPGVPLDHPLEAIGAALPPAVTAEVARNRDVLRELQVATERDATANLEPAALLDPVRLALLRAVSSAWRGTPARAAELVGAVTARLGELRGAVRIVPPPGRYTLASSDSPLLVTVSNDLPVSVDVTLTLSQTAGLRTGAVGVQQVPARSSRQLVIPAEVTRAGQFSVDARLATPGGMPLGQPSTLQLQSTALRAVTVVLTAGAGAVLVLLMGRRIARRVRTARPTGEEARPS